jgi:replicative DNA helicase
METRAEALLITKLIRECDAATMTQLLKSGFSSALFPEPYKDVIDYILKYRQRYRQLPSEEEIVRDFERVDRSVLFVDKAPKAAIGAIYDQIIRQSIRLDVVDFSEKLAEQFKKLDGLPMIEYIGEVTRELSIRYAKNCNQSYSLSELIQPLKEDYENIIAGRAAGIPIPFNFIQQEMLGWQPAQITCFLAKTGVGKTWILMLCAIAAASGDPYIFQLPAECAALTPDRKKELATRTLIVSCEMPAIDIGRRLCSIITKTSFNRLRAGKLAHEEKEMYFNRMDRLGAAGDLMFSDKDGSAVGIGNNIRIVGPDVASTPDQIMAQAEDFDAGLVLIDGFYYMSGKGDKRWEKVEGNMQQMRLHTLTSDRHYILASQFRRDAKSLQGSGTDDAAFSVSIGQDSNNMFGAYQPKALKDSRQLDLSSLKYREGNIGAPYRYRWDLYDMIFEEIGPVMESDGSQGDY